MASIVDRSRLKIDFTYVPYIFAWASHLQSLFFVPYSLVHETLFKVKYYRELFTLADGEKIALDWFEEPRPTNPADKRPLLVCVGGLGGGH